MPGEKNGKKKNPGLYDLRAVRYKKYGIKNLFSLYGFCKISLLVPYNS